MGDVFEIARMLVDDAVKNYGREIDLIAYYGSHARGEARDDSDLDIFYIPADGKNPPLSRTFLFDGLLFDFWPIDWKSMQGFASGHLRGWAFAPALVFHTQILHARSNDEIVRLEGLKNQVLDLQKPEARPQMINRALANFSNTLAHVANLRLAVAGGDLTDVRYAGWQVLQSSWECLALVNQVFFDRGLARGLSETDKFKDKPNDLNQLIKTIIMSPDLNQILKASDQLVLSTRQILRRAQKSIPSAAATPNRFQQVYPELKDQVSKLLAACENGDAINAHTQAQLLQSEFTMILNQDTTGTGHSDFNLYNEFASKFREAEFPDLMKFSTGSLKMLAEQARRFDEMLRMFLTEQSVDLCEITSLEELNHSLQRYL
jgi:hypothetical protein